ncbi:hypothetical protein [Ancylobacter polymorphus]|uniref:Uncharacterized protein n=1 Tax=Ancylobacter polymorphus TaxID=223390 RepID=A0A9E7A0Z3_9HYPH|nr:hypothetical protein [Ancylobacter polymorphus]UOK73977.1 hypothetical protein K9D25_24865 [Ancylobacter polymorphus]
MEGYAIPDIAEGRETRLDALRPEIDIGLEGESAPWDLCEIRAEARRRKQLATSGARSTL